MRPITESAHVVPAVMKLISWLWHLRSSRYTCVPEDERMAELSISWFVLVMNVSGQDDWILLNVDVYASGRK